MVTENPTIDPPLTSEEEAKVAKLSKAEVKKIDDALLSNATHQWRKVAMIVALTMTSLQDRQPGVPDLYYAERVRKLVNDGVLESQGNLSCMRYGEVRLPEDTDD